VADKICNEIDNCRTVRGRFHSNCANVLKWERGSGIQPQCSNECKQAVMAWAESDYRNLLCCDCLHDEMTAREKHHCVQVHRNIDHICNIIINSTCEVSILLLHNKNAGFYEISFRLCVVAPK